MDGEHHDGASGPQQLVFETTSPATRLLEKRRQMYEVQEALEAQKARFQQEDASHKKKEVSSSLRIFILCI